MSKKPLLLLGVGAGIAAYKAIQIVRLADKAGWQVQVLPTANALEMVGRKTWEALSSRPVLVDTFADDQGGVTHIELAREAKAVLIAPATADLLARMANGLANDLLTNVLLATKAPIWVAPAMHTQMWEHPATVENREKLLSRGVRFIGPTGGALSSGDSGLGRLVEPAEIWETFQKELEDLDPVSAKSAIKPQLDQSDKSFWMGKKVLITAGGTREPIDPVRFIGNRSSGRFGLEIARAFAKSGAQVTVLAANIEADLLKEFSELEIIKTPRAIDLFEKAKELFPNYQVLIMAAAVADFAPENFSVGKIKKTDNSEKMVLELRKNPDILATLAGQKTASQLVVGFAAETGSLEEVLAYGISKAKRKKADLLMLNQVGVASGFGDRETAVFALNESGIQLAKWQGSKEQIAKEMVAFLAETKPLGTPHRQ